MELFIVFALDISIYIALFISAPSCHWHRPTMMGKFCRFEHLNAMDFMLLILIYDIIPQLFINFHYAHWTCGKHELFFIVKNFFWPNIIAINVINTFYLNRGCCAWALLYFGTLCILLHFMHIFHNVLEKVLVCLIVEWLSWQIKGQVNTPGPFINKLIKVISWGLMIGSLWLLQWCFFLVFSNCQKLHFLWRMKEHVKTQSPRPRVEYFL